MSNCWLLVMQFRIKARDNGRETDSKGSCWCRLQGEFSFRGSIIVLCQQFEREKEYCTQCISFQVQLFLAELVYLLFIVSFANLQYFSISSLFIFILVFTLLISYNGILNFLRGSAHWKRQGNPWQLFW